MQVQMLGDNWVVPLAWSWFPCEVDSKGLNSNSHTVKNHRYPLSYGDPMSALWYHIQQQTPDQSSLLSGAYSHHQPFQGVFISFY